MDIIYRKHLKNFSKYMENRGYIEQESKNPYEVYRGLLKKPGIKDLVIVYANAYGRVTLNEKVSQFINDFLNSSYYVDEETESVGLKVSKVTNNVKDDVYWNMVSDYAAKLKNCNSYEECEEVLKDTSNVEFLKDIIGELCN